MKFFPEAPIVVCGFLLFLQLPRSSKRSFFERFFARMSLIKRRAHSSSSSGSVLLETWDVVSKNKRITSSQAIQIWKALISSFIVHDWLGYLISLAVVLLLDVGIIWYMVNNIKCRSTSRRLML